MKCANFVCLNEASGLKKLRGKFCKRCLADTSPFVFECTICKMTFVKNSRLSRIPMTCSSKCRNRRKYLRNGKEWAKNYTKKAYVPIKQSAKLCLNCDEPIKGFDRKKFCNKSCANKYRISYGALHKMYDVMKTRGLYLHQIEPLKVLA